MFSSLFTGVTEGVIDGLVMLEKVGKSTCYVQLYSIGVACNDNP